MNVYLDNIVFSLQSCGGISVVWTNWSKAWWAGSVHPGFG